MAPRFYASFIADSCACIPGRGTLYAAKRLESKIRSASENWSKPVFYLKCDLANFFVAIDKAVLRKQLEARIAEPWWLTGIADFNYPAFNAVADQLRELGYEVENPADHGIVEGAQWADYMAYDLTRLGLCGVIALLPDWEKSQGAKLEVLIAERLGMTVVDAHDLVTMEAV